MNITFDNVSFKYIDKKILDNASFSITENDKVGVVGVNGTGKTTLCRILGGLLKPDKGTLSVEGAVSALLFCLQDGSVVPDIRSKACCFR